LWSDCDDLIWCGARVGNDLEYSLFDLGKERAQFSSLTIHIILPYALRLLSRRITKEHLTDIVDSTCQNLVATKKAFQKKRVQVQNSHISA
jgi:hypothetical protein